MTDASLAGIVATSLSISGLATLFAAPPALLAAYVLTRYSFWGRTWMIALVNLPLVVPPTAIGFLLLELLSSQSALGGWLIEGGLELLFTREGAAIAVAVVIFPLVVRTAMIAFSHTHSALENWMRTFGMPWGARIRFAVWPRVWPGLVSAVTLGFTRGLGEFGATAVVAGMIPGQTLTLASAIFLSHELGEESLGQMLTFLALGMGLVAVVVSEWLSQRGRRHA